MNILKLKSIYLRISCDVIIDCQASRKGEVVGQRTRPTYLLKKGLLDWSTRKSACIGRVESQILVVKREYLWTCLKSRKLQPTNRKMRCQGEMMKYQELGRTHRYMLLCR